MTNDYYDRSKTHQEAIEEIKRLSGVRFDILVVDAFIRAADKVDL